MSIIFPILAALVAGAALGAWAVASYYDRDIRTYDSWEQRRLRRITRAKRRGTWAGPR